MRLEHAEVSVEQVSAWCAEFLVQHEAPQATTEEILAERAWLVPNLIQQGFTVIHGKPAVQLTDLSIDLASAAAIGVSVLGEVLEPQQTLLIARGFGRKKYRERLKQWCRTPAANLSVIFGRAAGATTVRAKLNASPETRLVVIDSINGFSNVSMLSQLATEYDCTIVGTSSSECLHAEVNLTLSRRPDSRSGGIHTPDDTFTLRLTDDGRWEPHQHIAEATQAESQLLDFLVDANDTVSVPDLCEELQLSRTIVAKRIQRLNEKGLIQRVSRGRYTSV